MATMSIVSGTPALALERGTPCLAGEGDEFDPVGPVSFDCGGDDGGFEGESEPDLRLASGFDVEIDGVAIGGFKECTGC